MGMQLGRASRSTGREGRRFTWTAWRLEAGEFPVVTESIDPSGSCLSKKCYLGRLSANAHSRTWGGVFQVIRRCSQPHEWTRSN